MADHVYDTELGQITDQDREYAVHLIADLHGWDLTREEQLRLVAQWLRKARYEAVIADRDKRHDKVEERIVKIDWQPMETAPEADQVFLLLAKGERGNGELAIGMVIRDGDGGFYDCYWTWGGPNSGSDIYETPVRWAPLPEWYIPEIRDMPDTRRY